MEQKYFHRNLIEAVEKSLEAIFKENKYADHVIEKILKANPKWGARDRRFIAETTYEIVRWWRLILFCGEIKEDAADVFPLAVRTLFLLHDFALPDWMRTGIQKEIILEHLDEAEKIRAIKESIPDWLDALGNEELKDQWQNELHALNEQARVVLRANTLKTTVGELQKKLKELEIETETIAVAPDALVLKKRANIFSVPAFKEGLFELQDASSQQVAQFSQVKPGMRIIDACAGGGGKTLHLAALMQNKGSIIALDTVQWKLDELKHRAKRGGATIIERRLIDSTKVIKRLHATADCVLLDVPCSGIGVLRRNPDAKWKLNEDYIKKVQQQQKEILNSYSAMVKENGKLIYATCSILNSENEMQVKNFLETHKEFLLEEEKRIYPSQGFDGFYMARMKRVN